MTYDLSLPVCQILAGMSAVYYICTYHLVKGTLNKKIIVKIKYTMRYKVNVFMFPCEHAVTLII